MRISAMVAVLALGSVAAAQTLREAGASRGILIGTAAQGSFLSEPDYAPVLAREYSQVEPENDMKWGPIHPGPDTYTFGKADALVSFAAAHEMKARGHTLVWHNQNPAWLTAGSFTSGQLSEILHDHIRTVVAHYAGKVYAWDVVNEAFNADGTLRSTIWYNQPGIGLPGAGYIEQAFRWARAADPAALLFYNDFAAEGLNAKSDAIYSMVKDFKARGVPIDGVGLQMHLTLTSGPAVASLAANLKRLVDLGLQVQFTELDIRLPVDASGKASEADLSAQARLYRDFAAACLAQPRCTAIQTWGFTDKHSWVPAFFPGFGAALPFDSAYRPKSAYTALRDVFATTPPAIAPAGLVNAASYRGGAIAPGEIVTLFGANLGPPSPAGLELDANSRVASALAGTRVTFNGAAAPLIYAAVGQVSMVVPYAVAGSTAAQVQYEYNGVKSNIISVAVATAVPAIFTLEESGQGQGAILNQDFSPNGASNPADKGSVVMVYGTGEGQTDPAGVDGQVAGALLPKPVEPVSATIAGLDAEVQYAGAAPAAVAGLLQVNVKVPAGAPSGAVPMLIAVGRASSQPGVTVAVR